MNTFTHYTPSDGAEWRDWTAGSIDGRSLRNRSTRHVKLNGVVVFALKTDAGRMWDCINGWRDEPVKAAPMTVVQAESYAKAEAAHLVMTAPEDVQRAQAYALRVWDGQSVSLSRTTRVERVKAALEGQNLSFDGVKLPGDDNDEWTEEDMRPVMWRKASA